jgi:hypothetical protein
MCVAALPPQGLAGFWLACSKKREDRPCGAPVLPHLILASVCHPNLKKRPLCAVCLAIDGFDLRLAWPLDRVITRPLDRPQGARHVMGETALSAAD